MDYEPVIFEMQGGWSLKERSLVFIGGFGQNGDFVFAIVDLILETHES